MSGRARGRGVARGRGAPAAADPARRPGSATAPASSPAAAAQVPVQHGGGGEPGNGTGRASHRGGARGEPRPGAGAVNPPVTQMAQMSIGTGDASQTQRRSRREISYNEPNTRPAHIADKRGSFGQPIKLTTNYFSLDASPGWQMYHYHIDFNPAIDSRKLRYGLLGPHADKLFRSHLFDGMQLFSPTKLPDEATEVFSERKYDSTKVRITIKRVAELPSTSPQCIQIFNVMMRQMLDDLGMKEVQRAYFSPHNAITLQNYKLEIWPGFKTSVLQYERDVLLNVDVSHKVLRTDSVLQFLYDIYQQCQRQNNMAAFKDIAFKKLVGEIVLTRYNNKTYRVDDIDWDIKPNMSFNKKDKPITYNEYYKEEYGVTLRDQQQPMLVSRPKRKDQREGAPELLYLVPELCTMTGLTDEMRSNFQMMKDLGVHTRIDPKTRALTMSKFRTQIDQNAKVKERMEKWGVKYSPQLLKLDGRVLPNEKIFLGYQGNQQKSFQTNREADWGRDVGRSKLFTTVNLDNWIIVFYNQHANTVREFYDALVRVTPNMGITVRPPKRVVLQNSSTSAFLDGIKANVDPSVQMVLVVLPSNKKDLYDAVKKQCCVETPVPSQCVTLNVLRKPKGLMSVVSKVAIQLNCKLGGEPWALDIPLKKLMVVGIDTYHDSAKKGRSVGGFVASLNPTLTRYYSQTVFQSSMQELIDGLKMCMVVALKKYHSVNNVLPERIIVYRDGVGDGQLLAVVEHEVKQILDGIGSLGSSYVPMTSVVVVKKRINSRFFATSSRDGLCNPDPGTVIDDVVTRRESYDFFVVSQSVRQGTVTPTHYNVIWDSSQLKPDHMQRLTYKLCHLYYNWPGTIRVPAPCQYAHKLAFLTGQSVHRSPDMSLADKLYYL